MNLNSNSNSNSNPIFVTATGTDVGKTVFSLLLMRHYFSQGRKPFYVKPFQTGRRNAYDQDSDAKFIYQFVSELKDQDPAQSVLSCFPNPKAPYYAACDEGKEINLEDIGNRLVALQKQHNLLIVEGSGGLLVPLTCDSLFIDFLNLMKLKMNSDFDLDLDIVLVAPAGLGTINHTLLSLEAMEKRNLKVKKLVFMQTKSCNTSIESIEENKQAIQHFSGVKVDYIIPHIRDFRSQDIDSPF